MKTRSKMLSLSALAILSLSALAPTQASAWGRGGYGGGERFEGGYRSMGSFGRFRGAPICEGFAARAYGRMSQAQAFGPMQGDRPMPQAQSFGPAPQQGYAPPPRTQTSAPSPQDSYEEEPEIEPQQINPNSAPSAYASKELQK